MLIYCIVFPMVSFVIWFERQLYILSPREGDKGALGIAGSWDYSRGQNIWEEI